MTDGNQTEGDVLRAVPSAGVPINVVPLAAAGDPEVYVSAVRTPGQVQDGVPFTVDVIVHSDHDDVGTVELLQSVTVLASDANHPAWPPGLTKDRGPLAPAATPGEDRQNVDRRKVKILRGDNRIPFTCTLRGPRSATLTARIDGFRDTIAENNSATAIVFSTGRPKALVLSHDAASVQHLDPILTGEQIDFEFRPALGEGQRAGLPQTLDELENYDLVILANVPAADLPQDRQEILRRYVRDFGGGLVVIGGDQAFTPGGYHGTTLEEILPVWCDFHRRQPRPSLAMVLVLDRSGSMAGNSIRLAKEAMGRAVEMLDPKDQVGVLVFDDATRWICPIAPCGDKRPILEKIATITAGGETDMGPAMDKAFLALNACFAQMKHMIIMTDGVSHPGDFESQAQQMAEAGITVSMVALGQQAARPEAEDIARLGKGHAYFCVDPADIPRIFALDTASASRVGIVEQPFFPTVVGTSSAMPASEIRTAPALLGYVGTRPKPTSQLILSSLEGDPLLSWWRYGLGVSVAFTSDLQSRWAAPWLRWPGLGRFWGQLLRHALRRNQAQNFALDVKRRGTQIELALDAVDATSTFVNGAKATLHVVGPQDGKGDSPHLCEAPFGPFRQMGTVPFSVASNPRRGSAASRPGPLYDHSGSRDSGDLLPGAPRGIRGPVGLPRTPRPVHRLCRRVACPPGERAVAPSDRLPKRRAVSAAGCGDLCPVVADRAANGGALAIFRHCGVAVVVGGCGDTENGDWLTTSGEPTATQDRQENNFRIRIRL